MCLFLGLGKYLSVPILTEWLTIIEYGPLDSSMCSSQLRKAFAELSSEYHAIFERHYFQAGSFPLSIEMVEWFLKRRFDLSTVGGCYATNSHMQRWLQAEPSRTDPLITRLSETLHSVEFRSPRGDCIEWCSCLVGRLKSLTSLSLISCYCVDDIMKPVAEDQLEKLSLFSCIEVTTQHMQLILFRQKKLRSLSINYCNKITPGALFTLQSPLSSLTLLSSYENVSHNDLALYTCYAIYEMYEVTNVPDSVLMHLWRKCAATLTTLRIPESNHISDKVLIVIIEACHGITDIDVSSCTLLTDAFVMAVASQLPRLQRFKLLFLESLTPPSLSVLLQMKHLKALFLGSSFSDGCSLLNASVRSDVLVDFQLSEAGVSAVTFQQVLRDCPRLTSLSLTASIDQTMPQILPDLQMCGRHLVSLELQNSFGCRDAHFCAIFPQCPLLSSVNLNNCRTITELSLLVLVSKCKLRSLQCDFQSFPVSTSTVDAIIESQARSLRVLRLFHAAMTELDASRLKKDLAKLTGISLLRHNFA